MIDLSDLIDKTVQAWHETEDDTKALLLCLAEAALRGAERVECGQVPDWGALTRAEEGLEDLL